MKRKPDYQTLGDLINFMDDNHQEPWYERIGIEDDLSDPETEGRYIREHENDMYQIEWPDHVIVCRYNSDAYYSHAGGAA